MVLVVFVSAGTVRMIYFIVIYHDINIVSSYCTPLKTRADVPLSLPYYGPYILTAHSFSTSDVKMSSSLFSITVIQTALFNSDLDGQHSCGGDAWEFA